MNLMKGNDYSIFQHFNRFHRPDKFEHFLNRVGENVIYNPSKIREGRYIFTAF